MAYYENAGRRNYFIEFGAGRPVLLLHGISNSGRAWGPQIPSLVEAGCRVIVPDLAGHGASRPIIGLVSVADLAEDARALLDHLGVAKADVVGLSLGGMTALQLALDRPERLRRLVIANSFADWTSDALRAMARGWASIFRSENGPANRLETVWPMLVNEAFRASADGLRTYQVWHGVAATADGPSLAYVAEGVCGFDITKRLALLSPPTLFIAGENDRMSAPAVSRKMAAGAPSAAYTELRGASHLSNVDSPQLFNRAVIPFLAADASVV